MQQFEKIDEREKQLRILFALHDPYERWIRATPSLFNWLIEELQDMREKDKAFREKNIWT